MSDVAAVVEKRGLKAWTTRDLLVTAIIGIVSAILMMGVNLLAPLLLAVNPILTGVPAGIYFFFIGMPIYIVRRPGAAILGTIVYGLASAPFHPFGWFMSFSAVMFALPVELPFLITRYRNYKLWVLMTGGAAGCLLSFVMTGMYYDFANLAAPVFVITLVTFLASGVFFGGYVCKLVSDALAKTGVLNSFAIVRSGQAE